MTEHLVYGLHAVRSLLFNPHRVIQRVILCSDKQDKKLQELENKAREEQIPIEQCSMQKMNQRFAEYVHQGIVAFAKPLPNYNEADLGCLIGRLKNPGLILILDGVTDPHNLGACLRSADATGVDFVIIPKDKSVGITPVVSKVACGAAETIPLVKVTNLVRTMEVLKEQGIWIYGAAGETDGTLYDVDCSGTVALVMGAEGDGLRRLTKEHCDGLFSLPMMGTVESLNVSVATGVCLYEVLRQRLMRK